MFFRISPSGLGTKKIFIELSLAAKTRDFLAELVKLTGCHYDSFRQQAVFGVWAPARKRRKLFLEVFIPERSGRQANFYLYKRKQFELTRFQINSPELAYANDFYFLVLKNLKPYEKLGEGCLYRFYDPHRNSFVPDIYSYFQPWGASGPSAVIDQKKYRWQNASPHRETPVSITKLHIGTASPEKTFAGFIKELTRDNYFEAVDAVELLPIGNFPGRTGIQLTYYKNFLVAGVVSANQPLNWGYDGGPNFPVSVSESYGTPDDFKALIDAAHRRKIKIGLDIQLNHYGPEGFYQAWYGPYLSKEQTEWGPKPNFAHPVIRRFLLQKLKEFADLYRADFLRLDMSSRYGDDAFIRELCAEVSGLPVILEDERQKAWLTDPQGAGAVARWSFSTVHNLKTIRNKHFAGLANTVDRIINKSHHSVIFANSHDEQGNHNALAPEDSLTFALAVLTNGIEMSWYSFGYFHFFCNYEDPVQLVKVTAEKCGSINHYAEELWPLLKPLHIYFGNFQDSRDFFNFIHKLWLEEVAPHLKHNPACALANVQVWIDNNYRLTAICEAYNQAIFTLANISNAVVSKKFREFLMHLKKLRKENKWLYTADTAGNKYALNPEKNELTVVRADQKLHKQITLTAKLGLDDSVRVN